ncbi:OVARIAN TUMOR DOMAIN-containing deubiquitinating enzyme 3-like isoform X3 [Zingiber officinale]|uniref:OVARIAN TUMOR DOMAIN-containing deubiquitinating enzyme 3-like isoform X3 n=1 Tax=Zingiber officinale TaxID=94328 RepID=UPI001C4D3071|nr:OVARIAN TUMOR DOMAIN-containing deubiquitinating enzyme 3-like isoform X3 [Zingiber officinale]
MCQVHWSLDQDHPIPFPSSPLRYLLAAESFFFCFLQSMAKGGRLPSNEVLLEQLRNGTAQFELLPTPVPLSAPDVRFFARIGSSLGGGVSPATKKVERYAVHKVTGDGRCMFRALVKGMANYKGLALSLRQEKDDADELRMAVKEIICDNETERRQYEEALIAITVDESLKQYCQRIGRSDFWGGESELLHTHGGWGSGFIPIAEYGSEFSKKSRKGKQREPVRLLYSVAAGKFTSALI